MRGPKDGTDTSSGIATPARCAASSATSRRDTAEKYRKSDWEAYCITNSTETNVEALMADLGPKVAAKMAVADLWPPGHSIADWSPALDDLRQIEPAPTIGQGETFMERLLKDMT
jgi:hypothetical protein